MTFEIPASNYAPGEKLSYRHGAGNDTSSKIQRLHGTITRLLKGTDDPDKRKTLEDLQSELNELEEDQIKLKENANDELTERRKDQDKSSEDDDPDALMKNRDVDEPEDSKLAAMQQSDKDSIYSVLSYKIASKRVKGDSLMQSIGVRDD